MLYPNSKIQRAQHAQIEEIESYRQAKQIFLKEKEILFEQGYSVKQLKKGIKKKTPYGKLAITKQKVKRLKSSGLEAFFLEVSVEITSKYDEKNLTYTFPIYLETKERGGLS